MKNRLILLLLGISILSGCSLTGRLYPVQGPLSKQIPLPVFIAKMNGVTNSGNISATLNDGEVCKGRWGVVPLVKASKGATTVSDVSANNMSAEWDTVYGAGFYVAHVLGQKLYVRAVVTGNRGTVLNMEMYRSVSQEDNTPGNVKGVAKDNKNNVYKMAF